MLDQTMFDVLDIHWSHVGFVWHMHLVSSLMMYFAIENLHETSSLHSMKQTEDATATTEAKTVTKDAQSRFADYKNWLS